MNGWPLVLLDSIAKRGSGHTPSQKHPEYWNGGIKWVSLADSSALDRRFIFETAKNISPLGLRHSSAVLHPKGTVIVSRDAGVGKSAILGDEMAVSQHFIVWRCDEVHLSAHYLYQWLQWKKPEFERIATGSTVKTIGLGYFEKLRITYPPIREQKAIAQLLDDWDTAIETAERLISAKERRHQALLIRLLGRRLWSESNHERADNLFIPVRERNRPDLPVLAVTQDQGVVPRAMLDRRITMESSNPATFKVVRKDDFVISLRSFQGGLEHSAYDGLVSPAYTVLRCRSKLLPRFYRHYLKSPDFLKRLAVAVVGIRDGKQINFADFASIRLPLPSLERQCSIADLLDESKQEITLLSRSLAALKRQKRGLMQKLLTGQWRVPVEEAAALPATPQEATL